MKVVCSLVRVALRTEGVDRNTPIAAAVTAADVALRTEGVDRNPLSAGTEQTAVRRPPYGGRG